MRLLYCFLNFGNFPGQLPELMKNTLCLNQSAFRSVSPYVIIMLIEITDYHHYDDDDDNYDNDDDGHDDDNTRDDPGCR